MNKNHLFKTDVSLRRSSDGGTTWANVGGPHADQHGMAWDPNVPNRVYLGERRRHVPLGRQRRQRLDPRHEHAVAAGVPRRRLADAAEPDRDRPAGQRLQPQLDERQRRGRRPGRGELELVRRRRRPLRRDRQRRRHLLLLVQPERRLQRRPRRRLDDDDAVGGGGGRRDERQARERHRPRRRRTRSRSTRPARTRRP